MIAGLRGRLESKLSDALLVEVGGVVYRVNTSGATLDEVGAAYAKTGGEARFSYAASSAIARQIEQPSAVRAVGAANGRNPIAIIVPCHRVIGANGSLVGFGGGLPVKRALLALECPQSSWLA